MWLAHAILHYIVRGFRHVPLEAASVESSGVQWSTANYVELIVNFNKSRLCQKSSKFRSLGLSQTPELILNFNKSMSAMG